MADVDVATLEVDPVQADLEVRLARLWSSIELVDRLSWRLLEGTAVDDDARAALTAAYTSATDAARAHGLSDRAGWAVRSTLAVVSTIEYQMTWAAKRWVEYATLALVCRSVVTETVQEDEVPEGGEVPDEAADGERAEGPLPVLVGGEFGWAEYEILTCTWRAVVGEIHPQDPPLSVEPEPEEEDGASQVPWWEDPVEDAVAAGRPGVDRLESGVRARMGAVWSYLNRPIAVPTVRL